jgi:phospholipid/cholesterol/gamma-HCH transport system substrate-binding protein
MTISTELKVGVFAVVGLSALGAMIVTLDGNPFASSPNVFYTQLDNVGGVGVRTQVRVSGVSVGEVTSIDVLPEGAKVNFNVRSDVEIPEGSFLELRSRGILGDVFIELIRNPQSTKKVKPGAMIPKRSEANDFNSLMTLVGSIARDLQTVSRSLAVVFGSSDGQGSLQNILHNVEKLSGDARELMVSQRYNIAKAIQALRDAATGISTIMEKNGSNIEETLKSVAASAKDAQMFTAELRKAVSGKNEGKLQHVVDALDATSLSIQGAMSKVQLIVDKVERGEGSLGQLVSRDEAANDIRQTLKSVKELLAPAQRLQIEVDYKGEYRDLANNESVGRMGSHFNFRLRTRPDQYYLLGVSDSMGSRSVSTTTTSESVGTNGEKIVKETSVGTDKRDWLRFNAQFGKRWSPVGLRFGIFESYPGFAADAYLFSDRVTASVEAFHLGDAYSNARSNDTSGEARLKAYGSFHFTPNLYLTGGVDGVGRKPGPFGFMGAGLRFTDDDLKSIVGAASILK